MKLKKISVMILGITLLLYLSGTFLANTQSKEYEALLGEWDVQTEDGQYAFVFKFSLEDGELVGKFEGDTGEAEMQDLTFEDNKITFMVELDFGGQIFAIDFMATIDGDELEGMLSFEYADANITGKKRK